MDNPPLKRKTLSPMLVTNELIEARFERMSLSESAHIFKIGVIDGLIERALARRVPKGSILGIATYDTFIEDTKANTRDLPNVKIEKMHAREFSFKNKFDLVCSFMCLILLRNPFNIFQNIYEALKPGGEMLVILPSAHSPLEGSFKQVTESGEFPEFKNIKLPYDLNTIVEIEDELSRIPFSSFKIETPLVQYELPSLKTFRDFLNIIAHLFQPTFSDELIAKLFDAQTIVFNDYCQKHYNGDYIFEFCPFVISATK